MDKTSMKAAGIDTGKDWLEIALYPAGERLAARNDGDGHKALATWLAAKKVGRVGIEASGGYERQVVAHLRERGFEVALLQPRQLRAFATYRLRRAKTDELDAALIARATAELDEVRAAPDPRLAGLAEHLLFIEEIEADIARLKTRLEHFRDKRIRKRVEADVAALKRRRDAELARLEAALRKHDDLARRLDLAQSVDGVGARTALSLIILLPELGSASREQIAALVGVAPYDDSSGKRVGERHIEGGRGRLRRDFNAAMPAAQRWNDQLVALYRRLTAKGKAHRKALIACVRKLVIFVNAVLERGTPWSKNPPAKQPA